MCECIERQKNSSPAGFEPATSGLEVQRAIHCAKAIAHKTPLHKPKKKKKKREGERREKRRKRKKGEKERKGEKRGSIKGGRGERERKKRRKLMK